MQHGLQVKMLLLGNIRSVNPISEVKGPTVAAYLQGLNSLFQFKSQNPCLMSIQGY